MEQNTSMMAKKIWNLMRVAFFLLRKGICKRKILMDLNLVMNKGKIASKALQNFMLNHPSSNLELSTVGKSNNPPGEYEFSCSNTPLYRHYFTNNRRKIQNKNLCMPSPFEGMHNIEDVNNMFDMIMNSTTTNNNNCEFLASPAVLGLGKNSDVRQLRIMDSPFLVQNTKDNNNHVDEAAEDFINKFYCQLKNQRN